jgi:phospholipid/cholesterol/gamma-HCH transport system substrate-binding protein
MYNRTVELVVGLFVLAGLGAVLMLALKVSNINSFRDVTGYDVVAYFDGIGGLKPKAPVTIAGVRVGRVKSIALNNLDYRARVVMTLEPELLPLQQVNSEGEALYQNDGLPQACQAAGEQCLTPLFGDASASILTAGLLGEQYIGLNAGGGVPDLLAVGDEIELTQSAIGLEQVVGQFIYGSVGDGESKDDASDDEEPQAEQSEEAN